jgi:hypothetical protein
VTVEGPIGRLRFAGVGSRGRGQSFMDVSMRETPEP